MNPPEWHAAMACMDVARHAARRGDQWGYSFWRRLAVDLFADYRRQERAK